MAIRWRHERWVKLYTKEEGTFAQLPLYVRALGAMLLKIADPDSGRICLRGKQPWEAIAFQLGADASDRRLLRKHIPVLIEDGYLELEDGDLFVRNFTVAQTGVDRVRAETRTNETRAVHEPSTSEARTVHEPCTTSKASTENQAAPSRRSEEKREEEKQSGRVSLVQSEIAERRQIALSGLERLNGMRQSVAAKFGLGEVMPLPSQTADEIRLRLAEAKDNALATRMLSNALDCLEAEANEERSVGRLSAKSFEPREWMALTSMTLFDARRRARARREIAERNAPRPMPRSGPLSKPDEPSSWFPSRSDEVA